VNRTEITKIVREKTNSVLEAADAEDTVHGLLSLLPGGGLLDSVLFRRVRRRARERLEEFQSKAAQEIGMLKESKVDHTFLESEEFDALVMKVVARTVWEHSEEKRRFLRLFLVNSATIDFSKNPLKETILELIGELSPSHVMVLQYFLEGKARGGSGWNLISTVSSNIAGLTESLGEAIVFDLFRKGLIDRESVEHFTNYEVSALGNYLLMFLKDSAEE
jgi:hypothetical protein